MKLLIALSLLISSFAFAKPEQKLYVGKDSTEAQMSFDFEVQFPSSEEPDDSIVESEIEFQLKYLFGSLSHSPRVTGVPKTNHVISNVSKPVQVSTDLWKVTYHYEGTAVIKNGPRSQITFPMPKNARTLWEKGYVAAGVNSWNGRIFYPCADPHYQIERYFWYFWDLDSSDCPLEKNTDYFDVTASIVRKANTIQTYPEYDRLVDSKGEIVIYDLFGMDDTSKSRNPFNSKDHNASNVLQTRNHLLSLGYSSARLNIDEIYELIPRPEYQVDEDVYFEELTKQTSKATVKVRIFFGSMSPYGDSYIGHHLMKLALETGSGFIYNGHSELGASMDLSKIEAREGFKINLATDQYQIYFFNSCTSYPYFNQEFYNRKKTANDANGTKQLDILTNGLSTLFSVIGSTNQDFFTAIDSWATGTYVTSYQELARSIDSYNLFGINGDEDNPIQAP